MANYNLSVTIRIPDAKQNYIQFKDEATVKRILNYYKVTYTGNDSANRTQTEYWEFDSNITRTGNTITWTRNSVPISLSNITIQKIELKSTSLNNLDGLIEYKTGYCNSRGSTSMLTTYGNTISPTSSSNNSTSINATFELSPDAYKKEPNNYTLTITDENGNAPAGYDSKATIPASTILSGFTDNPKVFTRTSGFNYSLNIKDNIVPASTTHRLKSKYAISVNSCVTKKDYNQSVTNYINNISQASNAITVRIPNVTSWKATNLWLDLTNSKFKTYPNSITDTANNSWTRISSSKYKLASYTADPYQPHVFNSNQFELHVDPDYYVNNQVSITPTITDATANAPSSIARILDSDFNQYYKYIININGINQKYKNSIYYLGDIAFSLVSSESSDVPDGNGNTIYNRSFIYRSKTVLQHGSTNDDINKLFDDNSTTLINIDKSWFEADIGYEAVDATLPDFSGSGYLYTASTEPSADIKPVYFTISLGQSFDVNHGLSHFDTSFDSAFSNLWNVDLIDNYTKLRFRNKKAITEELRYDVVNTRRVTGTSQIILNELLKVKDHYKLITNELSNLTVCIGAGGTFYNSVDTKGPTPNIISCKFQLKDNTPKEISVSKDATESDIAQAILILIQQDNFDADLLPDDINTIIQRQIAAQVEVHSFQHYAIPDQSIYIDYIRYQYNIALNNKTSYDTSYVDNNSFYRLVYKNDTQNVLDTNAAAGTMVIQTLETTKTPNILTISDDDLKFMRCTYTGGLSVTAEETNAKIVFNSDSFVLDGTQNPQAFEIPNGEESMLITVDAYKNYKFNMQTPFQLYIDNSATANKIIYQSSTFSNSITSFDVYADTSAGEVGSTDYTFNIVNEDYQTYNFISNTNLTGLDLLFRESTSKTWEKPTSFIAIPLRVGITQTPTIDYAPSKYYEVNQSDNKLVLTWIIRDNKPTLTYQNTNDYSFNGESGQNYYFEDTKIIDLARHLLAFDITKGNIASNDFYHFESASKVITTYDYIENGTSFTIENFLSGKYNNPVKALPNTIRLGYTYNADGIIDNMKVSDAKSSFTYNEENQYIHYASKGVDNSVTYYFNDNNKIVAFENSDPTTTERVTGYFTIDNSNITDNDNPHVRIDINNDAFIHTEHDRFYSGDKAISMTIYQDMYYDAEVNILLESCVPGKYKKFNFNGTQSHIYLIQNFEKNNNISFVAVLEDNKLTITDNKGNKYEKSDIIATSFPDTYAVRYFDTEQSHIKEGISNIYNFVFDRLRYKVAINYNNLTDNFYWTGDQNRQYRWRNTINYNNREDESTNIFVHYPNYLSAPFVTKDSAVTNPDDEFVDTDIVNKVTMTILAGTPIVSTLDSSRHATTGYYYTLDTADNISHTHNASNPFYYLPNAPYVSGTAFTHVELGGYWTNSRIGCRGVDEGVATNFCLQGHGRNFKCWKEGDNILTFNDDGIIYLEHDMDITAEVDYPEYIAYLYYTMSDMKEGNIAGPNNDNSIINKFEVDDDIVDVALSTSKIKFNFKDGIKFPTSKSIPGYTLAIDDNTSTSHNIYYDETFLKKLPLVNNILAEASFGPKQDGVYKETDIDFSFFVRCFPQEYDIKLYYNQGKSFEVIHCTNDVPVTLSDLNVNISGYTFAGWIRSTELPDGITDKILYMYDSSEIMNHSIYMKGQTYKNIYDYDDEGVCHGYELIPAYLCSNLTVCFNFDHGFIYRDDNYTTVIRDPYNINYAMGSIDSSYLDKPNELALSTYKPGFHIEKDQNDNIIWYQYIDDPMAKVKDANGKFVTITSNNVSTLENTDELTFWTVNWIPNDYTVSYYSDSTLLNTISHKFGESFFLSSEFAKLPVKDHYSLIGWGLKDNLTGNLTFKFTKGMSVKDLVITNNGEKSNIDLHAIFVPNIAHIDGVPFKNGDHYFDVDDGIILKCNRPAGSSTVTWEYAGLISQTN